MPQFTSRPQISSSTNRDQYGSTNLLFIVVGRSLREEVSPTPKLNLEEKDEKSLSFILEKAGTEKAESALTSARVFSEDSLLYMNREVFVLRGPEELAAKRGQSVFVRTAVQSLGDYVDANFRDARIIGFFYDMFLDNTFDKRIVSPLSPVDVGNPGAAYARRNYIHIGMRDMLSANPKGFITINDQAELDVTAEGLSFVLRNPIFIDKGKALVTALAVEYHKWNVNRWSLPRFGATLAYVHGNYSVNLTVSAGKGNFELNQGHLESRYEKRVMLYAQCVF